LLLNKQRQIEDALSNNNRLALAVNSQAMASLVFATKGMAKES
jgi:hypothetical protein